MRVVAILLASGSGASDVSAGLNLVSISRTKAAVGAIPSVPRLSVVPWLPLSLLRTRMIPHLVSMPLVLSLPQGAPSVFYRPNRRQQCTMCLRLVNASVFQQLQAPVKLLRAYIWHTDF